MFGRMDQAMMANGQIIKLMATVFTFGRMVVNTMVRGKTTICQGMEFTFMLMEFVMTASIRMIKRKALVFTTGQMVESMKDGGTKGSSMVLVLTSTMQNSL